MGSSCRTWLCQVFVQLLTRAQLGQCTASRGLSLFVEGKLYLV